MADNAIPSDLNARMQAALKAKGANYEPRTHLKNKDGSPKYTNRLIFEQSPYLIQHAHNPVDWHAWTAESFEKAKQMDKPIFLSIGYSTCHWCHVMEEESFDNESVAAVLNKYFIPIKVDREQRPDVDTLYMSAVMAIQGQGGWPLSAFITAEGTPLYGGTYYPRAAFLELLQQIQTLWTQQRQALLTQGKKVESYLTEQHRIQSAVIQLSPEVLSRAESQALSSYDSLQGGFGQAPKFPHESMLYFLMQQSYLSQNQELKSALLHTVDSIMAGGIYDQVGGGYHRYATDPAWLIPHFEKMLYNQAQMAQISTLAHALTGREWYKRASLQTLDYCLREMQGQDGLFYSATDADSEGEEGLFFIWPWTLLQQTLSEELLGFAGKVYGITPLGNFEQQNILNLIAPPEQLAQQLNLSEEQFYQKLDDLNAVLLKARVQRIPPDTDFKAIVAWNSQLIQALSYAGYHFKHERYLQAAEKALDAIWENLYSDQQLQRVLLEGKADIPGTLDDYAQFIVAMLSHHLYQPDERWLERSIVLGQNMHQRFHDHESGGYFMNPSLEGNTPLIVRPKEGADGAQPSGNAAAAMALLKLHQASGDHQWNEKLEHLLASFSGEIAQRPSLFGGMLSALLQKHQAFQPIAWGGMGKIQLMVETQKNNEKALRIRIPEGWHINSHQPGHPDMVATEIETDHPTFIEALFPPGEANQVAFSEQPISHYSGEMTIPLRFKPGKNESAFTLSVTIQACNAKQCLPPETLKLMVPAS